MKKQFHLFSLAALISINVTTIAQNAISFGSPTTKNSELITKNSLKGSGMCFTPNKGQIADTKGNLCPDILYKGDGGGADVYLRKTGMSYVTSNIGEVMSEIEKEVEIKKYDLSFSQAQAEELKHKLEEKALIKIQRTDVDFEGSNPNPQTLTEEEVEGYTNYYYAHCPNGVTNVKSYNRVVQKNIYNGIDVIYYGGKEKACLPDRQGLKYDIVVNPGANPNDIKLKYTGAKVKKLADGSLQIASELGETVETLPKVYQNINGKIVDVGCEYKLVNSEERIANREKTSTPNPYSLLAIGSIVSFELTTYNHEHPLIIDPYWATYYGGVKYDFGLSIATDALGNVFMKGETNSPLGIPSSAGFQTVFIPDSLDDFLVKFDANGVRSWATYYGGKSNLNGSDNGRSIATDASGNIFMTGQTRFLTNIGFGGFQNTFAGGISDAYLVKFNSAGLPIWSTYYGGIGDDWGSSVATDASGNVYLAGYTTSQSNIASAGFQNVFGGDILDAFLVKFDGSGSRIWATYYGGTRNDWGYSVDTDAAGNVYMSGSTRSTASIASGGFQNIYGGGSNDAFLVKFNTAGARIWGTYYGGNNFDYGYSVTVDAANNVYMAGYTGSGINIGSANGHQNAFGGFYDAFLVKVSGTGGPASRLWGTYYGSTAWEWAWDIVTDTQNNVYLFMEAEDVETPNLIDACSYQPIFNGGDSLRGFKEDQIIVKFNSNGIKLCATYMGGTGEDDLDFGGGITIYGDILYLTGGTNGGYPVTANAFQTIYAGPNGFTSSGYTNTGGSDAFIASLCTNICEGKTIGLDYTSNIQNTCSGSPVKFIPSIANSCDTTGYKYHWVFTGGTPAVSDSVSPTVKFSGAGSYDVKLLVTTLCKKDSITKTNYITITPCGGCTLNAQYTKGTANCTNCGCKEWIMVTGINGTPPYNYQWPDGYDRRYKNSLCPGVYNVIVTDNNGCKSTVKVNAP